MTVCGKDIFGYSNQSNDTRSDSERITSSQSLAEGRDKQQQGGEFSHYKVTKFRTRGVESERQVAEKDEIKVTALGGRDRGMFYSGDVGPLVGGRLVGDLAGSVDICSRDRKRVCRLVCKPCSAKKGYDGRQQGRQL